MRRDPSLHITRTALAEVLKEAGLTVSSATLTNIFRLAKPHQLTSRHTIVVKKEVAKKLTKAKEADNPITEQFQRILTSVRMDKGHSYVTHIKKSDTAYVVLKEVAASAYEFTEVFKISPPEEGYKKFINIGLQLIGKKYAINKFKYYKEKIFEYYTLSLDIENDDNPQTTQEFYTVWLACMLEYAGLDRSVVSSTLDYVNMLYGRQAADAAGASYEDWIISQFEGLAFMNAIPELVSFYGENATKRYERYIAAAGAKDNKPVTDKLPVEYANEAERKYYERLRKNKEQ